MPVRIALLDFLAGTYDVEGTTYPLSTVVANRATAYPVTVDANGLVCGTIDGHNDPIAAGPFLTLWQSLYDGTSTTYPHGFTCICSHNADVPITSGGGTEIIAISALGGPGELDLESTENSPHYAHVRQWNTGYVSALANPQPNRNNHAWLWVPLIYIGLSVNGGPLASTWTLDALDPLSNDITFANYGNPSHIQWIGLYDSTADATAFPTFSGTTTKPPATIPTGPIPPEPPPPQPLVTGGGILRLRGG